MSYPTCPHCGANRSEMPDEVPCWRCGRLPRPRPDVGQAVNAPPPTRHQMQTASENQMRQRHRSYIPLWLRFTGCFGWLLIITLLVSSVFLFVSADGTNHDDEGDIVSALPSFEPNITLTSSIPSLPQNNITATSVVTDDLGASNNTVVDPFALTGTAIQNAEQQSTITSTATVAVTQAVTGLPMASAIPTNTPSPTLIPTDIICATSPLPRLTIGGEAEVRINSLRGARYTEYDRY